jgi:type I restriction enzyme R subunit
MKELLEAVTMGVLDEDLFTSLASRLTRLEKQLTDKEKEAFGEMANGKSISQTVKEMVSDVFEKLKMDKPLLAPLYVCQA